MSEAAGFTVTKRNIGHWDITQYEKGRVSRIRGGPGSYWISDEREGKGQNSRLLDDFNTVEACMSYICDQLMHEVVVAEGQEVRTIESWNLRNNDSFSGQR